MLRLPDFETAHEGDKVVNPMHQEISLVLIYVSD